MIRTRELVAIVASIILAEAMLMIACGRADW